MEPNVITDGQTHGRAFSVRYGEHATVGIRSGPFSQLPAVRSELSEMPLPRLGQNTSSDGTRLGRTLCR